MKHTVLMILSLAIAGFASGAETPSSPMPETIPWSEIGARADAQYAGDGLSILTSGGKTVLKSMLQRLEGEATAEGLWVASVSETEGGGRFRIRAESVGRTSDLRNMAGSGRVQAVDKRIRWLRPGLVEEYSTGSNGIRQDFLVLEKPAGEGDLRVGLSVVGAIIEGRGSKARLLVGESGRELTYGRLHVTDATGRTLPAHMASKSTVALEIVVADAEAVYPVRIDPTFSDADWDGRFATTGPAAAVALDPAGILYAAITYAGVHHVAKWDGDAWTTLGSGMNGQIRALALSGPDLYAAGNFTTAGGVSAQSIARWNGSSWSALGSGVRLEYETLIPFPDSVSTAGTVYTMAVSGTDVYVGGLFTLAGGLPASSIAKWNGNAWSALGAGVQNVLIELTYVYALAVNGTDVYAGGAFYLAGGLSAANIAKWNGSAWSSIGAGLNSRVNALAVSGAEVYAGGGFSNAGGVPAQNIARWDGATWSALGAGITGGSNPSVTALAVSGTNLYAGGSFTTAGGAPAGNLALWDGSSWTAVGGGCNGAVSALAVSGGEVYAGGNFTEAGGVAAEGVAMWSSDTWSGLGAGMNDQVRAIAVSGSEVYVAGNFTRAGGRTVNRVARWNGGEWSALGSGMNGTVSALVVSGMDVYAGGQFTMAGGVTANRIARWDGTAWVALGSGMDSYVNALALSGTDLYAGGQFTSAGGAVANRVAKWNGTSWSALGAGVNNTVNALGVMGADLYAAGSFTSAGGGAAARIARWDGAGWSALGAGLGSTVYALAASGSDLYVAGNFTTAGGSSAARVAKWNGSAWSALGSGLTGGQVNALVVSGADLYAGGPFTTAGGISAKGVAKWDGVAWSALGSGVSGSVSALALADSDLWVGGSITFAGGRMSSNIALANNVSLSSKPEIVVTGDSQIIHDGDTTPVSADHTAFGGVVLGGAPLVRTFTVRNIGTLPLTLGALSVPPGFTPVENLVASLAPGEEDSFSVQLDSALAGLKTGSISFSSNDSNENPFNFAVSGTVRAPEIVIEQPAGSPLADGTSVVSFGELVPGVATNFVFIVRNVGDDALSGLAVTLNDDEPVSFIAGGLGVSMLAPGESTTFHVTFNPGSAGAHTAAVHIVSNDSDESPFELALTGHRLTALEAWRKANFGITNNTSFAADSADEDLDGVPNIVEFALDLNTTQNSAGLLPKASYSGGNLELVFNRPPGVEGVVFSAEWSTSLPMSAPTPVPDTGIAPQHRFSIPVGPHTRVYLRLTVTPQ